jgi:Mce-associated membrane protein
VVSEENGAQPSVQRVRRRASRAAGPAKAETAAESVTVEVEAATEAEAAKSTKPAKSPKSPKAAKATGSVVKGLKPVKPPPRRPAHRVLVGWITLAAALVTVIGLTVGLYFLVDQHQKAVADQARRQRFVDTATQMVVNMFSYKQDTIDESVSRFVNSTSGPLRGMLSANNAVENLKALFRATNATSEAVINGAALEGIDDLTDNASVLVSVRVTVADIDGVNKPSQPYRLRVIVHQDETGKMTGYDLQYPNGGN